MRTMEQKAADLASKIDRQIRKGAGKGLNAARFFAEARVKEAASVKAPTRRSKSGRLYATTPATPGAPLRVVSGNFWQHITSEMVNETTALIGTNARAPIAINRARTIIVSVHGVVQENAQGFNYPAFHEVNNWHGHKGAGGHKTFQPTIEKYQDAMGTIVGGAVKAELA